MSDQYSGNDYGHPSISEEQSQRYEADTTESAEKLLRSDHGNGMKRKYAVRPAPPAFISHSRMVLRILSFAFAITIIGLLAAAIETYNTTKYMSEPMSPNSPNHFDVWPGDLKLKPTYLLLGAAVVGAAVSLLLLTASVSSRIRNMTSSVSNVFILVLSFCTTALWIATAVYYKIWDTNPVGHDMMSWTCSHQKYKYKEIDFRPFCSRMRVAWYASVSVAVFELLAIAVVVYALVLHRRAGKGYARM